MSEEFYCITTKLSLREVLERQKNGLYTQKFTHEWADKIMGEQMQLICQLTQTLKAIENTVNNVEQWVGGYAAESRYIKLTHRIQCHLGIREWTKPGEKEERVKVCTCKAVERADHKSYCTFATSVKKNPRCTCNARPDQVHHPRCTWTKGDTLINLGPSAE